MVKAIRANDNAVLSDNVELAHTFMKRLRGLTFRKALPEGGSMHIKPCNSVHCCFMKFAIDVVFLDHEGRVVEIINTMKPWSFSKIYPKAESVLELTAGTATKFGLSAGDLIKIIA
ncbi:MAG: DUF192 domain-containing protein [Eubacteriales bacterium]|nr:DUF192 domain-containing protein [Eubacteriales bacterium]